MESRPKELTPQKHWVYEALVRHDKDTIGLIAYAFYKRDKHDHTGGYRAANAEEDVMKQARIFHDSTLKSPRKLERYRLEGASYLSELRNNAVKEREEELDKKHKNAIASQQKQHKQELKNEKKQILKNIESYKAQERSLFSRFGLWLVSGFPSLISAVALTALTVGGLAIFADENYVEEIYFSFGKKFLSINADKVGGDKTQ